VRVLRILTVLAAILAVSTAVPAIAYAATTPVAKINLNAPVSSGSQCMPCHATIGAAKTPGHIFQHGAHMTLSCDACHWAPAHSGGVVVKPSMQSCFNCHGLKHNGEVIARADCGACHTKKRADLKPADHIVDYAGKPHVADAKVDGNRCLMCHTGASCDACHVREGVQAKPARPDYVPLLPNKPARPAITIEPTGTVTIGQCVACHPDLDSFLPGKVIFAHATHLRKAFACKDCHRSFAHKADEIRRPDMPSCYQCHGLTHAKQGLVATEECSDCHPAGFALKPEDHTPEFVKGAHKTPADESPEQCGMCHKPAFCIDCHQGRPARPGAKPRAKVIPSTHTKPAFRKQHGQDYLAQKGACGSCHDSPSCEQCHTTPMPHPADWTTTHGLAKDLDAQDCKVCHADRAKCQECHHNGLRGAELVERNCVKCHPVMKQKPSTSIKAPGLAEHAVHFKVSEKKGEPYRCEQCHVGFGYTALQAAGTDAAVNRAHDLSTCYECHGALNYENVLIAPYPGYSLCIRCHSDLNL
jgi:hypothetical protein